MSSGHENRPRILVVDDNEALRSSVARALRVGCSAATAPHARAALKLLSEEHFDGVLADMHMSPGPDGLWLLTQVADLYPATRRFLMSSASSLPSLPTFLRSGIVDRFFEKPFSVEELLSHIAHRAARQS